jgi:hypothetical protein
LIPTLSVDAFQLNASEDCVFVAVKPVGALGGVVSAVGEPAAFPTTPSTAAAASSSTIVRLVLIVGALPLRRKTSDLVEALEGSTTFRDCQLA